MRVRAHTCLMADVLKREVCSWNKGRGREWGGWWRGTWGWFGGWTWQRGGRGGVPAKRRSTDLDVYPRFDFHRGGAPSLSSASLAASMCPCWTGCWERAGVGGAGVGLIRANLYVASSGFRAEAPYKPKKNIQKMSGANDNYCSMHLLPCASHFLQQPRSWFSFFVCLLGEETSMDFFGQSRFSSLIWGSTVIPLALSCSSLWLVSAQTSVSSQNCILKGISFTVFGDWLWIWNVHLTLACSSQF